MRHWLIVLSSMSLLALEGCASVNPTQTSAFEVDKAQVAAVEGAARKMGVQVYWLNYPQKKSDQ
jgi:outer membrane lipoprotein SlyB